MNFRIFFVCENKCIRSVCARDTREKPSKVKVCFFVFVLVFCVKCEKYQPRACITYILIYYYIRRVVYWNVKCRHRFYSMSVTVCAKILSMCTLLDGGWCFLLYLQMRLPVWKWIYVCRQRERKQWTRDEFFFSFLTQRFSSFSSVLVLLFSWWLAFFLPSLWNMCVVCT